MRVSHTDRERACAILREHLAAGRLDQTELTTRVASAQNSVTFGDLYALLTDLPALPGMALQSETSPADVRQPAVKPAARPFLPTGPGPGQGYRVAAKVLLVLGFFTLGIGWVVAVAFASAAHRAVAPNGAVPRASWSGWAKALIAAGILVPAAVVAVAIMAALGYFDSGPVPGPTHKVQFMIVGEDPKAEVGRFSLNADEYSVSGEGIPLPFTQAVDAGSLESIRIHAEGLDGFDGDSDGDGMEDEEYLGGTILTCTISVNGQIVAQAKARDDGVNACEVSYSN
ncbi:DUF1707 SHOCT-like domain-containing protein [Acrocarpospora macrocephala]|nr:DUF1707 domain-containing protein [Acrocarpospora macrocephala]